MRPIMKKHLLAALLATLVALFSGQSLAEEAQIHLSERLTSPTISLTLDADVTPVEVGTVLPTFRTTYETTDKAAWLKMFFNDPNAPVEDVIQQIRENGLLTNWIRDPEQERYYTMGDISTRFFSSFCSIYYNTTNKEMMADRYSAQKMAQAEGLSCSPEEAIAIADDWLKELKDTLDWDEYAIAQCLTLPAGDLKYADNPSNVITSGIYLIECERLFHGLPVARDQFFSSEIEGDMLNIFIDDSGILRVQGPRRAYEVSGEATVQITLDRAVEILQNHMDSVDAYPSEGEDGFTITEVGLCWRLVPILDRSEEDYHAIMEARPAWRFASGVCRRQSNVFVLYIDAETGEVLP